MEASGSSSNSSKLKRRWESRLARGYMSDIFRLYLHHFLLFLAAHILLIAVCLARLLMSLLFVPFVSRSLFSPSLLGGKPGPSNDLFKVLTHESAPAVEWLINSFKLDLSLLGRLGGHSYPRTHRGKERFPGMTITYALMEKFDELAAA